jgi:hypothetical protein
LLTILYWSLHGVCLVPAIYECENRFSSLKTSHLFLYSINRYNLGTVSVCLSIAYMNSQTTVIAIELTFFFVSNICFHIVLVIVMSFNVGYFARIKKSKIVLPKRLISPSSLLVTSSPYFMYWWSIPWITSAETKQKLNHQLL